MESTRGLLSSFETSVSLVEMFLMNEDLVERLRNRLESNFFFLGGGGGAWNGIVKNYYIRTGGELIMIGWWGFLEIQPKCVWDNVKFAS
jgi:hypothetical protein